MGACTAQLTSGGVVKDAREPCRATVSRLDGQALGARAALKAAHSFKRSRELFGLIQSAACESETKELRHEGCEQQHGQPGIGGPCLDLMDPRGR